MATTVRVLIVDDHALVRRGTREILSQHPGIAVIGEAEDGVEAVAKVEELQPDVVFMDLGMPRMSGTEAIRKIKKRRPITRIVALTVHGEGEYVMEAIRAGASGFLLKDARDAELINAVLTVAQGGAVIDSSLIHVLVRGAGNQLDSEAPAEPLTGRELDVLRLVARGLTNQKIGDHLGMSARTAEVHLRGIFKKLGVSTRTEAAISGLRSGILNFQELR